MHRLFGSVGIGVVLSVLGMAPAMACGQSHPPVYPEAAGWTAVDETDPVPAGYACDVAVTIRYVGHERTTELGHGVSLAESPDEVATVTNTENGRSVGLAIGGTLREAVRGTTLVVKGRGASLITGPGVSGIRYVDGVQRFRVTDFESGTDYRIHLDTVTGRNREVCHLVGARAVPGKALPEAAA